MVLPPQIQSMLFFWSVLFVTCLMSSCLIGKFIPAQERITLRPVTQPSLTVVGMMFSILVGFFIADAMRGYSTANQNAVLEANNVGSVFRLARGLDEVDRKRLRGLCREYVHEVITNEWIMMAEGKDSEKAWEIFQRLWEANLSVNPQDERESLVCQSTIAAMESLGEHRRARVGTNTHGLSLHLWVFIAIGAGAIVSIIFMFAPESKAFRNGILTCILVPLSVNAYILAECSFPFSGVLAIKPKMFELMEQRLFVQPDTPPRYLRVRQPS